jgi:serine/threonine protein kinase
VGCHNILVKSDGTLVLADFGGSRIDGSGCLEFPPARYSRPKTAHDRLEPTEKDDLFALGTALYEISTGQLLYHDLDEGDITTRFSERDYPDMALVPPALQQIIVRCWSEKYTSADEVARDLERLEASSRCLPSGISLVALGLISATLAAIVAVRTRRLDFHNVLRAIDALRPWGLRPWK